MVEQLEKEIWKDIPNYEGIYQASNLGNIKNLQNNQIRKPIDSYGKYLMVQLSKNGKRKLYLVHRLVAKTFIPNPLNKAEVNHIDGNKHNNCVYNLEWTTRKENAIHSVINGLQTKEQLKKAIICMREKNSKPLLQIKNGKVVNRYNSVREASRENKYSVGALCECANGKYKKMYGFEWRYE